MSMDYVRNYYHVPAKRGGRIRFDYDGKKGTITRATAHIWVRFDGCKWSVPLHPTWMVTYL
jgi:hypothetical protein